MVLACVIYSEYVVRHCDGCRTVLGEKLIAYIHIKVKFSDRKKIFKN